jgi:hypothetical protein
MAWLLRRVNAVAVLHGSEAICNLSSAICLDEWWGREGASVVKNPSGVSPRAERRSGAESGVVG